MENIICRPGNALAAVRALPRLAAPSMTWQLLPRTLAVGALSPVISRVRATIMPAAGTYLVADLRTTTASDTGVICAGADHKFSTRLGPTPSPPV
jgi:hypothetical protein